MNYSITYNPEKEYFLVETRGRATVDEIGQPIAEILASPHWQPTVGILLDHSDLDMRDITSRGFYEIVRRAQALSSPLKGVRCAVIFEDDFGYGLSNMWRIKLENDFNKIFRSREEAEDWLDSAD